MNRIIPLLSFESMTIRLTFVSNNWIHYITIIVSLCVAGCGEWPPVVNSARDIRTLPSSTQSVRARGLADTDIAALQLFRSLRELDFCSGYAVTNAKIPDKGLAEIAKLDLPLLTDLSLGYCDKISDAGVAEIAKMNTLKTLQLTGCSSITDASILILNDASSLAALDLRGCEKITDEGIQELAQASKWELIQLGGCMQVTAAGLKRLREALPKAKIEKDDQAWDRHYRFP